jgi:GNAT superfamily N-acetyltransferase
MLLKITKIKVKDLLDFADASISDPKYSKVTPLSQSRARAYANNPHADSEDIGLLVALLNNECIGYLGIMPGLLKTAERVSKVHWFCTFFIAAEHRGKGYGSALIKEAFSLRYDFVVSSMSAASEGAFRSAGMRDFGTLTYYAADLRWMNPASLILRLIRSLLRASGMESRLLTKMACLCDRIFLPLITFFLYALLAPALQKQVPLIRRFKQESSPKDLTLRADTDKDCAFMRDEKTLTWMFAFPWTVNRKNAGPDNARYFFTAMTDSSDFTLLRSTESGFALFSCGLRSGHRVVKALDSTADSTSCAFLLLEIASRRRASGIECSRDIALSLRRLALMRFFLKPNRRLYLFYPASQTSPLSRARNNIVLDYCDGENPFA